MSMAWQVFCKATMQNFKKEVQKYCKKKKIQNSNLNLTKG